MWYWKRKRHWFFATLGVLTGLFMFESQSASAATYQYKGKYGPLRIGTLWLNTPDSTFSGQDNPYHITVKSNPDIFFLDVHSEFTAWLDELGRPERFISTTYTSEDTITNQYFFNFADSILVFQLCATEEHGELIDSIKMQGPTYDGLSALLLIPDGRINVKSNRFYSFFDGNYGPVELIYQDKSDQFSIPETPDKKDASLVKGKILFEGIAGWTGKFKAWVGTNHLDPVFFVAKLKILIGSITLTLESIH